MMEQLAWQDAEKVLLVKYFLWSHGLYTHIVMGHSLNLAMCDTIKKC